MSIIMNDVGACVLVAWEEFDRLLDEAGIENPERAERQALSAIFKRDIHPVYQVPVMTFDSENYPRIKEKYAKDKELYHKYLNQYIAETVFLECGYNKLKESSYLEYLDPLYRPCEGGDNNCNLDCRMNGECKYDKG